ncbi:hypothetical protein [Leifsonia poae]|uniref:hypothetical protein n=1 Tax=Leifsonia poae TaxID=110933 RepID=UPI001CBE788A|nr:hypothetical protein [Leifsonia poae]
MTTELGTFSVNIEDRTVEGILLPFGETSRLSMSKTEPIYFSADAVSLPADASVVTLNREHDQFSPVGRAIVLEKRDEGVYAKFAIARTPEGDEFLTKEYPAGRFKKLSAEILGIVRDTADKARAVAGKITGAALTTEGAFESAALFSADDRGRQSAPTSRNRLTRMAPSTRTRPRRPRKRKTWGMGTSASPARP